MKNVRDNTGRFGMRPHYEPKELDRECEKLISDFLKKINGKIEFPITTDDLTKLIEQDAEELDMYSDLSSLGSNVEGVTEFRKGRKPTVRISASLSENDRFENRLRTTLTHEYGHVHYHRYLFEIENANGDLLRNNISTSDKIICKRDSIIDAKHIDWMEWQAGYVSGALLMPITYVSKVLSQYKEQHNVFSSVHKDSEHGKEMIGLVMEAFKVSNDAARVRLIKLNHLGEAALTPSLFA